MLFAFKRTYLSEFITMDNVSVYKYHNIATLLFFFRNLAHIIFFLLKML